MKKTTIRHHLGRVVSNKLKIPSVKSDGSLIKDNNFNKSGHSKYRTHHPKLWGEIIANYSITIRSGSTLEKMDKAENESFSNSLASFNSSARSTFKSESISKSMASTAMNSSAIQSLLSSSASNSLSASTTISNLRASLNAASSINNNNRYSNSSNASAANSSSSYVRSVSTTNLI